MFMFFNDMYVHDIEKHPSYGVLLLLLKIKNCHYIISWCAFWILAIKYYWIFLNHESSWNIHWWVESECCCSRTVDISSVDFIIKYICRQSHCLKIWDSNFLALITQMVRAFRMSAKVGGSNITQVETFIFSKKLQHFHNNKHSWVLNECRCPRTVNISNVNFTAKITVSYLLANGYQFRDACKMICKLFERT